MKAILTTRSDQSDSIVRSHRSRDKPGYAEPVKVAAYQAPLLSSGSMHAWRQSHIGSSRIVDPVGNIVQEAMLQSTDVLVVNIETSQRKESGLPSEAKPVAIRIANDER